MLMKWAYDTHRPHGLKETTELLLGYEDWDAKLYEVVRSIASRRSRVLTHEEDFLALKMHGYEPDVVETKRGKSYRWASKLSKDKKLAAYALADLEDVRIYNSLDSVYTKLAFNELMRRLSEDEDRAASCEFRHRIGERIMRCEQRGVWTNRELNRDFSAELEKIENKTRKYLVNSVAETNPEIDEFNPNSPAQLVKVIFGEPTIVPWIDKPALYRDYARHTVDELIDRIHLEFYDDFADVKEAGEAFNFESCKDELLKYAKKVHRLKNLPVIEKKVYLDGMVRPNDERGFTKSGNPSTATFLLNEYYTLTGSEFLAMLLMYKKASKLKSVFVDGIEKMLDNEGILRGRFNLTGTRAGRLSSSNPNCQNYPKSVRGQHQPRPGYRFVEFDLSAAEVRTIAAMSGDKALLEACQAIDMHKYTASNMFHVPFDEVTDLQRQRAKTLLFGILYGMSAFRLSYALKITVEEAESLIEDFFRTYSTLKDWIDRQPEECKQRGYHAVTLFGTKCSVKNLLADKMKEKSHAQGVCSNAPIQGTAGELTLWYICEIMDEAERRGLEVHLFNTTHDSGSFEVPIAQCEEVEQLIHEIVGATLDIEPLHLVKFKADTRISDYWSDEPNIFKAVDPKYEKEGSTVPWHLINAEEHMDKEDLEELEELEQTYEQRAS